jgi:hypothetical protein
MGWQDDGDHGLGKYLLRIMEEKSMSNAIVFITREYGGNHIGFRRFQIILQLFNQIVRQVLPNIQVNEQDQSPQRPARGRNNSNTRGNRRNPRRRNENQNNGPPPYAQVMNIPPGNTHDQQNVYTSNASISDQGDDEWTNTGARPRTAMRTNLQGTEEQARSTQSLPTTPNRLTTEGTRRNDIRSSQGSQVSIVSSEDGSTHDVTNQRGAEITDGRQM